MADSPYAPVLLGRWDLYRRTPSLSLQNGRVRFIPGSGTLGQFAVKEAAFPTGARLEYRIQKGDRYFEGDHSQSLGRTLSVTGPDGSKTMLASGFVLYMNLPIASRNLEKIGIPFRAVSYYEEKGGQVVENEIPIPHSRARLALGFSLASSNLWLGLIAGAFIHSVTQIFAIGVLAFVILATITIRSAASGRAAFVTTGMTLFTYAAGYAVSVVLARWVFEGFTRR